MNYAANPANLASADLAALQRELTAAGFDPGPADGKFGPRTRAAWEKAKAAHASSAPQVGNNKLTDADRAPVDARSEGIIATLLPAVQPLMRAVINRFNAQASGGVHLVATSGLRTYAEQDALYRQRPKVTNAPAGFSNHNFGLAADFTIFIGKSPLYENKDYHDRVGPIGKSLGLFWGGDWASIDDEPHLELRPAWAHDLSESAMLAELRRRHAAGQDLLA